MVKVACLISNRNMADYICRSIQSVFDQTMKDWLLIIVDAGSTDDSVKVIKAYLQGKPESERVIVKEFKEQKTVNAAFKFGWGMGSRKAEYLTSICSDNLLMPEAFAKLSGALEGNKTCDYSYADYYTVSDLYPDSGIKNNWSRQNLTDFNPERLTWGSVFMFRSSLWKKYGDCGIPDDPVYPICPSQDCWIAAHYAQYTNFVRVPEPLYIYRFHQAKGRVHEFGDYGYIYNIVVKKCETGELIHKPSGKKIKLVTMR